jgi:membrane protein implicated in regulation of membrane protease activity
MTINMSTLDRRLRAFVGTALLVLVAFLLGAGTILAIVLFALAAVMLATSAASFCPFYTLFRFNTAAQSRSPTEGVN